MSKNDSDQTMAEQVPLFPLDALLLPGASLPLQIFEPRYLMMVSRCSRENSGFAITLGEPGLTREVRGCLGRIIDFGQRDNGMLGITVAGECRVSVNAARKDATGLWWGHVESLPEAPVDDDDARACLARYQPLLDALLQHPYLATQSGLDLDKPCSAVHQLMVWLPLETAAKKALLVEDDFMHRCQRLETVLSDLAGAHTG